ncbi:MAG TPA: ROK family transcriptional regulator [Terracidiphilus sp.]|jgi:predicted NBD/HSP70 family sugar kinase
MTDKPARQIRAGASSQTAREINRDVVLHTIHMRQPVSRADLTRLTGLQASTVSIIIGQLIEEGWVLPGTLGHLPRGRRPTFVTLNDKHVTLAIDLRPGKANLAVIDINGKILSRRTIEFAPKSVPKADAAKAIAGIAKAARSLRTSFQGRMLEGVGVSVSGRVDQDAHRLVFSPNAPWAQVDLENELQKTLKTSIVMENAANASLFAERWFGKIDDTPNMVVVSVSEGIGAGMLVDGRLVRGREGMAGEFGHMPFDSSGPVCGCGNVGCWETFASNRAGLRYYNELAPEKPLTSFQELLDMAAGGDLRALRSLDRMATYLARGLAILVAGLAPELIIIVGDCTVQWSRIRPLIEAELNAKAFTSRVPRVVPAMDGDAARLRGAAALVVYKALFRHGPFEQVLPQGNAAV